ncbi:MAG: hypothetical protein M3Z29_11390 [Pseudomonadota bacterium]|nr:hypothetical protein [Pseudomonadota bacterium]
MRHVRHLNPADAPVRRGLSSLALALVTSMLLIAARPSHAGENIPSFSATALTGHSITPADLLGKPTVLILTPSKGAAADTRKWAKALRQLGPAARIRDVLAIDLPFFMSESDAIGRAKAKIPARYYDQTWLMSSNTLESALGVPPSSSNAFVFVVDAQGHVVARISGNPTQANLAQIQSALKALG